MAYLAYRFIGDEKSGFLELEGNLGEPVYVKARYNDDRRQIIVSRRPYDVDLTRICEAVRLVQFADETYVVVPVGEDSAYRLTDRGGVLEGDLLSGKRLIAKMFASVKALADQRRDRSRRRTLELRKEPVDTPRGKGYVRHAKVYRRLKRQFNGATARLYAVRRISRELTIDDESLRFRYADDPAFAEQVDRRIAENLGETVRHVKLREGHTAFQFIYVPNDKIPSQPDGVEFL